MEPLLQNPVVQGLALLHIIGAALLATPVIIANVEVQKIKEHRLKTGHDGSQECNFVVGTDTCCYVGRKVVN